MNSHASEPRDPRLAFLHNRTSATTLTGPAPSERELRELLEAACAVPDHKMLQPYRFVVARGDARAAFGDALAAAALQAMPELPAPKLNKVREKAFFAPALVALVSSPREANVPVWEQEAAAACTGFALVLAAEALGFGAVWKSAPVHEGAALYELLGLRAGERFLGWVNVGTRTGERKPRSAPDLERLVTHLRP